MNSDKSLSIFIVDAFTQEPFSGNPAAVCCLKKDISAHLKQQIAAEMNLSETAFVTLPSENCGNFTENNQFRLKWFTPTNEVNLCGHATLASASIIFDKFGNECDTIEFQTLSGVLKATRNSTNPTTITLDFPVNPPSTFNTDNNNIDSLLKATVGDLDIQDIRISETTKKLVLRLSDKYSRQDLEILKPDTQQMMKLENSGAIRGVIVTLRATNHENKEKYDFYSRYFAPWNGIPEDPVTGSAHTVLAPYWSTILNQNQFNARQCSKRGGDLMIKLTGQQVEITGQVVHVLQGTISI